MNDRAIRDALKRYLHQEMSLESTGVLVDELSICGGETRADVALLEGVLHGFEIKSAFDKLDRLPRQTVIYGRVFERATLVVSNSHMDLAKTMIPGWWGLIRSSDRDGCSCLRRVRKGRPNPSPDAFEMAMLLWRGEALSILEEYGGDWGVRSKPLSEIIVRLVELFPPKHLAQLVRRTLRKRGDWKAAARQKRGGGLSRRRAKSLHSPDPPFRRHIPL